MTESNKIEKLVFVLAIAFCWTYKTGEDRRNSSAPRVYSNKKAQEKSKK